MNELNQAFQHFANHSFQSKNELEKSIFEFIQQESTLTKNEQEKMKRKFVEEIQVKFSFHQYP
jgi:hypothetical protein